jgi:hypothetical protein
LFLTAIITTLLLTASEKSWAFASNNIPLDSPIYLYLEKLAGFGLVSSDFKGIRPYSKAEAARLVAEAEGNLNILDGSARSFAKEIIQRLQELLPREVSLRKDPSQTPFFAVNPVDYARSRYVDVNGVPRNYERPLNDSGGAGVFGIGGGLRPTYPYPNVFKQQGNEGTPLFANNDGIVYRPGSNYDFRFASEVFVTSYGSALIEPVFLYSNDGDSSRFLLNKAYVKLGGGGLELEVGRDENWLGLGYQNAITLTNNARNFDEIKLSSPEPLHAYAGLVKYDLIFSQFDKTYVNGQEYQPYFIAAKLSLKPMEYVEFGMNYGKMFAGPGVSNTLKAYINGLEGGVGSANTKNLAGLELRLRLPFLWNTEIYGEFSGEDSALFWPVVESYVAGIFIPHLTSDGKNDLRFEYFLGNNILYDGGPFPEGYMYRGMPIGDWQGGASEEFFVRYTHWFSLRSNLALEYFHIERGNTGRLTIDSSGNFDPNGNLQAIERTDGGRVFLKIPLFADIDLQPSYGFEYIRNLNLIGGVNQTNQIITVDLSYKY